jgi:hypothetical protein
MLSLEEIHEHDLYITQSRVRDAFRDADTVVYLKKEFAFRGGRWDGREIPSILQRNDRGKVLVLGDSDREVPEYELHALRMLGGYRDIWSTHAGRVWGERFHMLPLGLPYDRHYGFPFDILGNTSLVAEAYRTSEPPKEENVRIMGAFAVENAPERPLVRDLVIDSPIGVWDSFDVTVEDRLRYLRTLRECGLVACPRGRGIDTYRLWEALYMGAVPIVAGAKGEFLSLLRNYSVLLLESWTQLGDIETIRERYSLIRGRKIDATRLRFDEWKKLLSSPNS